MAFDADDEGDFQKVVNPRKKHFQKEEAEKVQENAKSCSVEQPKATALQANMTDESDNSALTKKDAHVEDKTTPSAAIPAPWLRKTVANQNDDQKGLKRIQIEEEEVRQIELQIKRENQRREQEIQKQRVMTKPMWKPVVVEHAAGKEKKKMSMHLSNLQRMEFNK
jgi:hypothetical protein